MALADELKKEAKKYETVKTAELEWTDRIKLDHLILFLKEQIPSTVLSVHISELDVSLI